VAYFCSAAYRAQFIPEILAAAEAADVFVERVIVTLRRS
jgi:hypothetical protein